MSIVRKVFCLSIYTLFFLAGFAGFQGPASKDANKSKSLEIQAWRFKLSFVPVDIKQLPPPPPPHCFPRKSFFFSCYRYIFRLKTNTSKKKWSCFFIEEQLLWRLQHVTGHKAVLNLDLKRFNSNHFTLSEQRLDGAGWLGEYRAMSVLLQMCSA